MTPPAQTPGAGTAQPDRLASVLRPGAVGVDERSTADLLGWAERLARLLRYRTAENTDGGDWSAFLERDPSALVAAVARTDLDGVGARLDTARADLASDPSGASARLLAELADLATLLARWRRQSAGPLREVVERLTQTSFASAARDLQALALRAEQQGLTAAPPRLLQALADLGAPAGTPDATTLPDLSSDAVDAWADRLAVATEALRSGAGYLAGQAPGLLDQTLATSGHAPHAALFLAGLRLFRHSQEHVNGFAERHLMWTYRDVMGLRPRAPVPESARVVFDLARGADRHLLPAGTLLRGDKDADGTERLYATDDDLAVGRARVERLLALQVQPAPSASVPLPLALVLAEVEGVELVPGATLGPWKEGLAGAPAWVLGGRVAWPERMADHARRTARVTAARGAPFLVVTHPDQKSRATTTFGLYLAEYLRQQLKAVGAALGLANGEPAPLWLAMLGVDQAVLLTPGAALVWTDRAADAFRSTTGQAMIVADLATGEIHWHGLSTASRSAAGDLIPRYWTDAPATPRVWAAPVADSSDGLGAEIERPDQSWAPLGDAASPSAEIGWAVASDVLLLGQGERRVEVTVTVDRLPDATTAAPSAAAAELAANVHVWATAPDGWAEVATETVQIQSDRDLAQITFRLILAADAPPVTGYDPEVHGSDAGGPTLDTDAPVLRFDAVYGYAARPPVVTASGIALPVVPAPATVPEWSTVEAAQAGDLVSHDGRVWQALHARAAGSEPSTDAAWAEAPRAHPLRHVGEAEIEGIEVGVQVVGMTEIAMSSDSGVVDSSRAFMPWGAQPRRGARATVSHPELEKPLTHVALRWTWQDLPETPLATHYLGYTPDVSDTRTSPITTNHDFTATVEVGETSLSPAPLFQPRTGIPGPHWSVESDVAGGGPLRLTLMRDFLHRIYPKRMSELALASVTGAVVLPDAPYTPLAADLALDYRAAVTVEYAGADLRDPRPIDLFHLGPFGAVRVVPVPGAPREIEGGLVRRTLLPTFQYQPDATHPETAPLAGALAIGLAGADAPETVSLLIQVAQGTADPDMVPPVVTWQVLESDTWRTLRADEVLADTTGGLVRSGIVRLALPRSADEQHRMMPDGLRWVRAAVGSRPDALPRMVAVIAQAMSVTRVAGLAPRDGVLPAETLSKMKTRVPAIASMWQPFASERGIEAEGRDAFVRRASERTGHRARAIRAGDAERIALQAFPQLHRVRCVSHARVTGATVHLQAPGSVVVVVVPDVRRTPQLDPLRPRASRDLLDDVTATLAAVQPGGVALEVRNPTYEAVRVQVAVRFVSGVDVGYGLGAVDRALVDALAPWREGEPGAVQFGGRLHRSWVLRFLESHAMVDAVRDLRLIDASGAEVETAQASSPLAVLTSARSHTITEWTPAPCPASPPTPAPEWLIPSTES